MQVKRTNRGFEFIPCEQYTDNPAMGEIVQASSAVDTDTEDGIFRPGTSYLWFRGQYHLNRGEVTQLRDHLTAWLETGSLEVENDERSPVP